MKKRYRVSGIVGRGGQNLVYRATDIKKGFFERNEVVLKEMRWSRDINSDLASMSFFKQEVELLSKLKHPYLPEVFEFFINDGKLYIVEEFIEGPTLEELLKDNIRIHPLKVVEFALKIAEIFDFLHQQSNPVYYRDLKPSNIIVQPARLYLVDFSGCYIPGYMPDVECGIRTQGYCPPEAYTTKTADASFDVYTLGMLMYRMLTGFNVGKFTSPAPPLHARKDRLPGELVRIVNKATRRNKISRYHTIWEMKLEMERVRKLLDACTVRDVSGADAAKGNARTGTATAGIDNSPEINRTAEKVNLAEPVHGKETPGDKTEKDSEHILKRTPIRFQIVNALWKLGVPLLDLLVFLIIPLMFCRDLVSRLLPFKIAEVPLTIMLMLVIPVVVIHFLYRHWLDMIRSVAQFNRKLHLPVVKMFGLRPIYPLVILEITLLLYIFIQVVKV